MAATNMYMSLNNKNKRDIRANVELIQDAVHERDYDQRDSRGKLKVAKGIMRAITGEKGASNIAKAYDAMLDHRLYGIHQVDAGNFLGLNTNKLVKNIMGITGDSALMLNASASIINAIQGNLATMIAAHGGRHFNKADALSAGKEYISNLGGIISDVGRVDLRKTNKIDLMMEKFDMMGDFSGMANDLLSANKASVLAAGGANGLHGFSSLAEHQIQGTLMIALMRSVQVFDKQVRLSRMKMVLT